MNPYERYMATVRGQTVDHLARVPILMQYAVVGNSHMVNAGCEIPADTPEENLRALCAEVPFVESPVSA